MPETPTRQEFYSARTSHFDRCAAQLRTRMRRVAWLRLAVFAGALPTAWRVAYGGGGALVGWVTLGVLASVFVALLVRHRIVRGRLNRAVRMAAFNREGVARVERRWDDLPPPGGSAVSGEHDYAADLDLSGHASLFHLAGACSTGVGWRKLQEWLLDPADPASIRRRQESVAALAGAHDFRDLWVAEARGVGDCGSDSMDTFLAWVESPSWLSRRPGLRLLALALPAVNVAALLLHLQGLVPAWVAGLPLVLSAAVWRVWRNSIDEIFDRAGGGESGMRGLGPLLDLVARMPGDADGIRRLRRTVQEGTGGAARPAIAALRRLLDCADIRRSPLFHLPLAIILLWDLQILGLLERWKARSGPHARAWLGALGEADAITALATLAADHPGWVFPTVDPRAASLRAQGLGHPLLAPGTCVGNDVQVGPSGTFLLVTGSNMSGKSTMLRAIGLNVVLAQAGGPVSATQFRMPPLRVVTSIQVRDSLASGTSFFMAELRRLKLVVDRARNCRGAGFRVLYILDEVLQGTNSVERRIATGTVIQSLLESGAIGVVSTHDMALATADRLVERAVAVHFTDIIDDDRIIFDYRLREGVATSTNALRLLERIGLGDNA